METPCPSAEAFVEGLQRNAAHACAPDTAPAHTTLTRTQVAELMDEAYARAFRDWFFSDAVRVSGVAKS